ncbi:unnamed protein product [Chrysoparadoxa australica]
MARDLEGNDSTLHGSVALGLISVVEALLHYGADLDARNNSDFTPLMVASFYGRPDCALALLNAGADAASTRAAIGQTALYIAMARGHTSMLKVLLQGTVTKDLPSRDGVTPLMLAASLGHLDGARALISAGANLEAQEMTDGASPLHIACTVGNAAMTKLLLLDDADVNPTAKLGTTPLMMAVKYGNADCRSRLGGCR